jgi:hypothetical protein
MSGLKQWYVAEIVERDAKIVAELEQLLNTRED